ncbi:translocation/assembly module TamB domain-containing protein, partial [Chamaesiphon sp. GL140_3_metabinner_50]|uniref:translocation/assembly module TamB domain-containing protein n=1 Tax=Chamaesiphon sp. GL140_3_metabinner_50 TaxID=2970812 RepID=UPI0025DA83B8
MKNNSPDKSRRWLKLFLKTGSKIGLGLFLLLIGAIGWGQWWAKDNLSPLVSQELTKSLKRPVSLGKIDSLWLNEVHFKDAKLPTNGSDLNSVDAPDTIVSFNPIQLLFDRTLKLDVRLVNPSIYVAQNAGGNWVNIPAQDKQAPPPVKIQVGTIAVNNAKVTIVPYSQNPQPIVISKINLEANVNDFQDRVKYNGGAQIGDGGQVSVLGESAIANGETELVVNGQKLDAVAATRIVKIPEVTIARGTVDGDLKLAILPGKYLRINSDLLVRDGKVAINNVPRSLDEVNGFINVSERAVKFNGVTTKYDRVAGVVKGTLDYTTGYQLTAKTAPTSLPDVFKSIDIKSPFPLAGAAVAELQLTGKLDNPILTGKFNNSQLSQVDRVQIERVNGNFRLADSRITLNAIAQPKLGGKITTQGEVRFLKTPTTNFKFRAERLPGDALLRLYGAKFPAGMRAGDAVVTGTIGGTGADINTNLKTIAPQATYPLVADLQITPQGKTIVKSATLAAAGGKVQATGVVTKTNWQLNLQPQAIDSQQLAKIGGVKLASNYRGKLTGNIRAAGLNNDLVIDRIQAQGQLNLQLPAGKVTADRINIDRGNWQANVNSNALDLQQLVPNNSDRDPLSLAAQNTTRLPAGIISGNFNVSGNNLTKISPTTIAAQGQGKIKLKAGEIQSDNLSIANGNWQGIFTASNLQLSELNAQVGGRLNGKFNLAGNLKSFTPESLRGMGMGSIDLPQGKVIGTNLELNRGKWQGNLQASSLLLGGLAPQIPLKYRQAKLTADLKVAGDLQQLQPEQIAITGNGKLSFADGTIRARQLEVGAGKWRGNFEVDRLKLGDANDKIPTELTTARLQGNFTAAGELAKFNVNRLQLAGNGELQLADGKVRATDLKLDRGNLSSNLVLANFKLGSINSQLTPQLKTSKISGNFNVAANVNKLVPAEIQASGNGKLKLANGGEIKATDLRISAGAWRSNLAIKGLKLGEVNRALPAAIQAGLLFGNFQAAGNLKKPELEQIQVNGNGRVQNILGGNIQVNNLIVDRGKWQTRIVTDRLNISELAKFAPSNVAKFDRLAGQLNANLQIGGDFQNNSLANLKVAGQTGLTNFQVGSLKFDPNLIGNIQANPGQGVDIAFTGKTDRLALTLDRNLQPQSFDIQQSDAIATGTVADKKLNINIERLPLALLQPLIPKNAGVKAYRFDGNAAGNITVDLKNYQVTGDRIEITNPIFGAFQGDRLLANFRYANGTIALNNTEIQRGAYTYKIDASFDPSATTPTFQAKLQVPSGNIEDIRNLLQIFSTADLFTPFPRRKYGTAADLGTKTSKLANRPQPLNTELRSLSELRQWLNRQADRQQTDNIIPDLGNLQGDFSGDFAIASSPKAGLTSNFNISGSKWQLERYNLDRLRVAGNWNNGKLHLEPLELTIDNSQIAIAGDFGVNNQNAKVNIQNFPIKSLTSLIDIPVDINGGINLSAQIGGTLANPRINGEASISDAQLNNTKLQGVAGNFNYVDGRLNFASDATFANSPLVDREDRIKITGSIPYQLPFALTPPASNDIKIDLSLQNQGLQILDVLSKQQLHWIDGQGKIALNIGGKMKPKGGIETLTASGTATITKGRIKSVAIPEPLTDVNGDIIFDFDRVDVQKLTGKFNRGQIAIAGIIPISDSFSIDPSRQLALQMNGIAVDLKDKYQGDVNGKLTILGTALNPILTGNVQLSNGQVFLPNSSATTTSTILGIQPVIPEAPNPNSTQLRNLQVTLGDNLQITRAPILSFIATGKIDLDGTIDNPRPFGQVKLQKGSVNLFTTQFRLAGGEQTADFFPTLGTDPVLNLRLVAKTLESASSPFAQRNSVARTVTNGEIDRPADFYTTSLGSVQTVQVEARVAGLASQLTQRLELTSTPARTQPEIVLLLGGAIAERLTSGGDIGLGVVSLASSTLLNSLQDRISDIFSLSDFRLFPTITTDSKTNNNSTFGIAAEVGTEITPRVSASIFKILTNSESPYYSLRYRVNDQILLRGSTNLFGENRAIVEFEQRF